MMTDLIRRIIAVESSGNSHSIGDTKLKNRAYGILQIRKPCLDDVNRANGTSYKPSDMLGNIELSIWLFEQYMKLYATEKRIGRPATDEDMARIWCSGPLGFKKEASLKYWNKVKNVVL